MITVTIKGNAKAHLAGLQSMLDGNPALMEVIGTAATEAARNHYRQVQKDHPNKRGWKRQNFWSEVARSVFMHPPGKTTVRVGNSHEAIAQKVQGGVIRAKKAKALTIPLIEAAYGKRPEEYETQLVADEYRRAKRRKGGVATARKVGLFVFKTKAGNSVLASQGRKGLVIAYLLKRSVTQKADPHALPDPAVMQSAALEAAANLLDSQAAPP